MKINNLELRDILKKINKVEVNIIASISYLEDVEKTVYIKAAILHEEMALDYLETIEQMIEDLIDENSKNTVK